MGDQRIIKSLGAFLIIIVLAVLIVNVNKLIAPKMPTTSEQDTEVLTESPESDTEISTETDYKECFNKDPSTIVFVHSNSCPHCRNMMPIIKELEEEGYNFYWAESSDNEARETVNQCFSDLLSGYVPQFICPKTGKEQTGGMTKDNLKKFADNCV